ncbi:MAG: hypothetical protein K6G11_10355 [Lachnospiraceae bacterium]|nr:hypothetical protein [Lachnospiraceae bacterium]
MDDFKTNRKQRTRKAVNDFISFFEREYGISSDNKEDYLMDEEPDEKIIYNWDGSNELFKAINDASRISDYVIEKGGLNRFIREFKVKDNPIVPEKEKGYEALKQDQTMVSENIVKKQKRSTYGR